METSEEFIYDYIDTLPVDDVEDAYSPVDLKHEYIPDQINSPIPEVAATIPITDNVTLPTLTFRFWILSTLLTIFTAASSQYFYFRYNSLSINVFSIIIASYPLGHLMALLPLYDIGIRMHGKFYGFSLNPGQFNIKEHALIVVAASTSILPAYAIDILAMQRLYYSANETSTGMMNLGWIASILLLITSQLLGFGITGFIRNILVYPAHMWWPQNLVTSNLLHTFHGKNTSKVTVNRMFLFKWVLLAITIYQFFPGFIMPILQSVAFLCLIAGGGSGKLGNSDIWPSSLSPFDARPMIAQMGSGLHGGGILSFSFDWESIGSLAPLYTPLWAQLNYLFANYSFTWLIIPLLYKSNFWDAQKFPMYSTDAFTKNGTLYNITQVLNPWTYELDYEKYESYSPVRLSTFWALAYGCSFATLTAAIVHVCLFHGVETWNNFKCKEQDIHTKMMKRYKEVPLWWYASIFLVTIGLSIFTIEFWNRELQLKWWGLLLSVLFSSIFVIPVGIIQAISNKQIGLNVFAEVIIGLIQPGKPLANSTFKTYGYTTVSQCLSLVSDLKLGQYMKIPPRAMFVSQLYGTVIGAIVNYGVFEFLLKYNPDIWRGAHDEAISDPQWRSTSPKIFYTASVVWGGIGPSRVLGSGSMYQPLLWFFIFGAIIPIPFYLMYLKFPKAGFHYIHWPIILESVGATANGTANAILPVTVVSILFQYVLRIYKRNWYDLYNYTTSAALDVGTLLAAILIYSCIVLSGISSKYGYNIVHPDVNIWDTPEYCYNRTFLN